MAHQQVIRVGERSDQRVPWLALILALSVLARVATALYLGDRVEALPGTYDQISYDMLAQRILAGKGYSFATTWYPAIPPDAPTAFWSFLYPLFLAGAYGVVGYHPLVARLLQAVAVGLLMPWLVYRLGRRTFSETVGLAAAAAIAVYLYLVYYSATLMTEPFYIVTLLWSLDVAQRIALAARRPETIGTRRGWARWAELGLAWGLAALLRQQVLLLAPLLLAWLLWATWGRIPLRRYVLSVALALAVVAAFILPWTLRNYVVYDDFLPLNSNVGYALYAANHPQQGNRFEPLNLAPVPKEWQGLNEAEQSRLLTAAGIGFVLAEPGRFAFQTLDRFRNYFRFWPLKTSPPISNVSRVLSFGLYLPFMVYGLVRSLLLARGGEVGAGRKAGPGKPTPALAAPAVPAQYRMLVSLLYLYMASYATMHLLTWAMHRYRLPVDAVLMVFVGLAAVDLYRRLVRGRVARPQVREAVQS